MYVVAATPARESRERSTLGEMHRHDDVQVVIAAHRFEDAGCTGRLSFDGDLSRVDHAEHIDDIAGVEGDLAIRAVNQGCLLYTSPSPRDRQKSRMPSSA